MQHFLPVLSPLGSFQNVRLKLVGARAKNHRGPDIRSEFASGFQVSAFGRPQNDNGLAEKPLSAPPTWLIRNKIDLIHGHLSNELRVQSIGRDELESGTTRTLRSMVNSQLPQRNESKSYKNEYEFSISATTGEGFDALLAQLERAAKGILAGTEFGFGDPGAPPQGS